MGSILLVNNGEASIIKFANCNGAIMMIQGIENHNHNFFTQLASNNVVYLEGFSFKESI